MSPAGKSQGPLVALSTASVFPDRTPDAFEMAARLGYDGIEVMVSADAVSQDVDVLHRLVDYHGIPVLAVHAPCLLVTQRVWGREPWGKLTRSAAVAEKLGAKVVVVHPPFRWQRDYARDFPAGLQRLREETGIVFAVENMYPLRAGGAEVAPYSPHWNPVQQDYPAVTLDLSHTSVSGSDALAMAGELGSRLAHVHMADGTGVTNRDEHLVPGRGAQPCAPLLEKLAADRYRGVIVLEVNTRRAATREARRADLAEALEFTRQHLGLDRRHQAAGGPAEPAAAAGGSGRSRAGSGSGRKSRSSANAAAAGRRTGARKAGPAGTTGAANGHDPAGSHDPGSGHDAVNGRDAANGHGPGTGHDPVSGRKAAAGADPVNGYGVADGHLGGAPRMTGQRGSALALRRWRRSEGSRLDGRPRQEAFWRS